jgi:hypothetical protein
LNRRRDRRQSLLAALRQGRDAGIFIPFPRWPTFTDVALFLKLIDIKEDVNGFDRLKKSLGH